MPRDFTFHKDRMNMLAGLVEEDDFEETRHALAEEYRKEMNDDVEEVSSTLKEYTAYMGYRPEDSEGELEADCECPEKAKPAPEESGLPGWSYYDADPTYSKISTMKKDLQHKKELQWVAPLESELEEGYEEKEMDEADASAAFKAKINGMINEHSIIHGMLPNGIGFGESVNEIGWGVKEQPGRYGRFTHMPREEVQAHLESRGFAVYDTESDDELRDAAYQDELEDPNPGPYGRV